MVFYNVPDGRVIRFIARGNGEPNRICRNSEAPLKEFNQMSVRRWFWQQVVIPSKGEENVLLCSSNQIQY